MHFLLDEERGKKERCTVFCVCLCVCALVYVCTYVRAEVDYAIVSTTALAMTADEVRLDRRRIDGLSDEEDEKKKKRGKKRARKKTGRRGRSKGKGCYRSREKFCGVAVSLPYLNLQKNLMSMSPGLLL